MKELTQQEINEKKWKDFWSSLSKQIQNNSKESIIICDTYSLGVSYKGMFFVLRGSKETFKFENNTKVFIKATSSKTGKFIKVFEYDIRKQTTIKAKQSHYILKKNNKERIKFLEYLKDCVVTHFKPNSIKFILEDI